MSKNWKPMSKHVAVIALGMLVFMLLISLNGVQRPKAAMTDPTPTVKIGDYIQFGKYDNQPILWRVIHLDSNGDPMLFAERILSLKAFDAKGNKHKANTDRLKVGSNYYADSNIRQWLNSKTPSDGTNLIVWKQNPPIPPNVLGSDEGYADARGFLSNDYFSTVERSLIKLLKHKVMLAKVDASKTEGGNANLTYNKNIDEIVQNYNVNARYQNVTDSVFLLSVKQLKEYVRDRGWDIRAKPTAAAIKSLWYDERVSKDKDWIYWLNTPVAESASSVRCVISHATDVGGCGAATNIYGVRPALQLKKTETKFAAIGDGSQSKPYKVIGSSKQTVDKSAPSTPNALSIGAITPSSVTVNWSRSRDNIAVAGYDVFQNGKHIGSSPTNTFKVNDLFDDYVQQFSVRAFDAAGNQSAMSKVVTTTPTIFISGKTIYTNFRYVYMTPGVYPVSFKGQTMVPYQTMLQSMRFLVEWDRVTKTVKGTNAIDGTKIKFTQDMDTITIKGVVKRSPVAPRIINGYLMIPIQFIASELGYQVITLK
jgi:hypothetical protein